MFWRAALRVSVMTDAAKISLRSDALRHAWRLTATARATAAVCAVLLSITAWAAPAPSAPGHGPRCVARGIGLDSQCAVNGVNLHFVDWGGNGGELILVAGLDDSARIFDELAALLTPHHRVIAVTRRGFCGSSIPADGYDAGDLARDFSEFLEAVGVKNADIVGHSMAGLELTRFAAGYHERVRRLVYLDAATDKSSLMGLWQKDPAGNRDPPPSALSSLSALTAWTEQLLKSRSPAIASNVRQCYAEGPGGLGFRNSLVLV